jgi:hypothetical protein
MKITVIGKGLAGSLAASHFHKYLPGYEIEWVFDPKIETQSVGEGSVLTLPRSLFNSFGFSLSEDLPFIDGTIKTGLYKKNWNNKSCFSHDFPAPNVALHFNTKKLQEFIFRSLESKIKIKEAHIENNLNVDSDFIFDCSGTPENIDDNFFRSYVPVNSVHVNQCYWDAPKFNYTLTIARPYGWVFGIPLTNRCSVGYLYNNSINSIDEIKEDITNIFSEFDLEPSEDTNSFSFNSYYRENMFTNRLGYNGNSSFFLEPLEALSTGIIDYINRSFFDMIAGNITYKDANKKILNDIVQNENLIMLHYLNQGVFDTEFWNFAKERAKECLEPRLKNDEHFLQMYNETKDIKDDTFLEPKRNTPEYGNWWQGSFVTNFRHMGLHPTIKNML